MRPRIARDNQARSHSCHEMVPDGDDDICLAVPAENSIFAVTIDVTDSDG